MLTLATADFNEFRLLTGALTEDDDLTDAQINGATINGAASDWAQGELIRYVNINDLSHYTSLADLRNTSINDLSANELTTLQQGQLKRAVLYRGAGIAVELLRPVTQEGSSDIITQRRDTPDWQALQTDLYAKAEDEIDALRAAYPDDAFLESGQAITTGFAESDGAFFCI